MASLLTPGVSRALQWLGYRMPLRTLLLWRFEAKCVAGRKEVGMRRLRRALYVAGARAWVTARYRAKVWSLQRTLVRTAYASTVRCAALLASALQRRHLHALALRLCPADRARRPALRARRRFLHRSSRPSMCTSCTAPTPTRTAMAAGCRRMCLPEALLRCVHGRFYTRDFQPRDPATVSDGQYFLKPSLCPAAAGRLS